jgi:hypothetical protein
VEVGAPDIDGVLLRPDGRCNGGDEAIGDVVHTVGVRDDSRRSIRFVGDGDAELVEDLL